MPEALGHLAGDYLVQTDWMAAEKTSRSGPALVHAVTYAACFLPRTRDWRALLVIGGTHFVIDRWRLAKCVCWAKNQLAPRRYRYPFPGDGTGYSADSPPWLNFWLMVAGDNCIHLILNHWALKRWAR